MAHKFQGKLVKSGVPRCVVIPAQNPAEAKRIAEEQYPAYRVTGSVVKGRT